MLCSGFKCSLLNGIVKNRGKIFCHKHFNIPLAIIYIAKGNHHNFQELFIIYVASMFLIWLFTGVSTGFNVWYQLDISTKRLYFSTSLPFSMFKVIKIKGTILKCLLSWKVFKICDKSTLVWCLFGVQRFNAIVFCRVVKRKWQSTTFTTHEYLILRVWLPIEMLAWLNMNWSHSRLGIAFMDIKSEA